MISKIANHTMSAEMCRLWFSTHRLAADEGMSCTKVLRATPFR